MIDPEEQRQNEKLALRNAIALAAITGYVKTPDEIPYTELLEVARNAYDLARAMLQVLDDLDTTYTLNPDYVEPKGD